MDKGQALNNFWNSFGWTAYDEYTTPEDIPDAHITYEYASDGLDVNLPLHATIWDRSSSWSSVTQKAEEIAHAISTSSPIALDTGGYMWIKKGEPFAQRIEDETDDMARGMYINIIVEYLTEF